MSFVVSDLWQEVQQELNIIGQAVSEQDFFMFLNNTDTYFKTVTKMPTAERMVDLMLYGGVSEYPLESDFDGFIEPRRPYAFRTPDSTHETTKSVIAWPFGFKTSVMFDRENPYAMVNWEDGTKDLINGCDSLTENGTVTISGDGSSLVSDTQIFVEGTASIRFTVTASGGTTTVVITGMTAVNLTDTLSTLLGKEFIDLQCPSTNTVDLTSVALRLGSDSSNYYEMTATTRHRGDGIGPGWGLISFDPSTKTTTGSPDVTAIDYCAVVITHGLTGVNGTYRLDNIFASQGTYFQLPYYSTQNVKASDGSYKEYVTASDDTVLCPSPYKDAYKYKVVEMAAASPKINNGSFAAYAARELAPRERKLKSQYPSQMVETSSTWYKRGLKF